MVIRSYDDMAICWCGDTMIWWYDDGMIGLYDGAMTWWNDGMTAWWYDGTIIWWYDDMIWDHRSEISDLISMILKSDLIWSWSDLISDLRSVWSKDRKKIVLDPSGSCATVIFLQLVAAYDCVYIVSVDYDSIMTCTTETFFCETLNGGLHLEHSVFGRLP